MATAPRVFYPDGSGDTSELVLTTNVVSFSFSGTVDPNVVDVQIDLNGSGFTSDPSLVGLSAPGFSVPNPSSHPGGLVLERGKNVVRLRAVDITGAVSPASTVTVFVSSESAPLTQLSPPTGVELRRRAASVDVMWSGELTSSAVGYNVYASTGQGGTVSGYLRVNSAMIPASSPKEVRTSEVPVLEFDYDFHEPNTDLEFQIVAQTADAVTGVPEERKSVTSWPLFATPDFRFKGTVARLERVSQYAYGHDRSSGVGDGVLNNDVFSGVHPDDPLHYVVTAVYYSRSTGEMTESRFSREVSGAPLPLDTSVRGIRIRDQKKIAEDYIGEVQRADSSLSLIPGSTVREVHIETFANEMQKAYFLMDFVHRAKSFPALLAIDDPTLSGTSVPVANSAYKQSLKTALAIADDSAVQALVDGAFDSLARNNGVKRQGRRLAMVQQTFWTASRPTRDLTVQQNAVVSSSRNSNAPRFRSLGASTMLAANAQSYYNPDRRRYEMTVQLVAEVPGTDGNVPAGDLDTVVSGAPGFQTVNLVSADYGRDVQSNLGLAEDAMRAVVGVDSGTVGGYDRASTGTSGVYESRVVASGDPNMMRDWDPVRKVHTGGKVDIWVKGTIERTVEETFAFQFSSARAVRFDVIDPSGLVFRARDSRLTPDNPIQEILNNPGQGLGLRNHSVIPLGEYDLTGAEIVDYQTIRLSNLIPQPPTSLDDFVEGDYRYRSNNRFVASVQPVRRVVSVVGEVSGVLDPAAGYSLFKLQDPLLDGESTAASDFVTVNQVGSVPSGASIPVNAEEHVLLGEYEEPLRSVGVNVQTLRVYSRDRSVLYQGPDAESPDYYVVGGGQTKPVRIVRSGGSAIQSGATVSVDYEHDENFRVTYVVNDVLHRVQSRVGLTRHAGADVLVKQAVENPMSLEATVQLAKNAVQSVTDASIRTAVSLLTDRKGIGESIHQTDVSTSMARSSGVQYVSQPFSRMTLRDGALRIRDGLPSQGDFVPSLSRYDNAVYVLDEALPFATVDGGGPATSHRGVYMDNVGLEMARSLESLADGPGRAWIVGASGAVIPGLSDDATLAAAVGPAFVTAERLRRTANRVFVSLRLPDAPSSHSWSATYTVSGDRGVKDIDVSQVEYLTPGDVTITYRDG